MCFSVCFSACFSVYQGEAGPQGPPGPVSVCGGTGSVCVMGGRKCDSTDSAKQTIEDNLEVNCTSLRSQQNKKPVSVGVQVTAGVVSG